MQASKRPFFRTALLLLLVTAALSLISVVAYRSYVAPSETVLAGRRFVEEAKPHLTEFVLTDGEMPALLGKQGGASSITVKSESHRALLLAVIKDALNNSPRYGSQGYAQHRIDATSVSKGVSVLLAGDGYAFSLVDEPDVWYGEAMFLHVVYGCVLMLNCPSCGYIYLSTQDSISRLKYQTNWRARLRVELEALARLVVEVEQRPDRQLSKFWEITGLDRTRFQPR